ncbi:MAG: hypothetical protein V2A69_16385 [Pseudomonadota bacterium]
MKKTITPKEAEVAFCPPPAFRHSPTDAAKLKEKDESIPFKDFDTLHRTAIRNATSID